MRIGILPKHCAIFFDRMHTAPDYRKMEIKIHDELYIENAVYCLADILCDWLLAMRKESE